MPQARHRDAPLWPAPACSHSSPIKARTLYAGDVPEPPDELIPPDDPRFEGTQFISSDAAQAYNLGQSDYLRGAS